jgi:hypothetical protein
MRFALHRLITRILSDALSGHADTEYHRCSEEGGWLARRVFERWLFAADYADYADVANVVPIRADFFAESSIISSTLE